MIASGKERPRNDSVEIASGKERPRNDSVEIASGKERPRNDSVEIASGKERPRNDRSTSLLRLRLAKTEARHCEERSDEAIISPYIDL
jgi:hypothetical protein